MDKTMQYMRLKEKMDAMIEGGMNSLDPISRSIDSKLMKLYRDMDQAERNIIDNYDKGGFYGI